MIARTAHRSLASAATPSTTAHLTRVPDDEEPLAPILKTVLSAVGRTTRIEESLRSVDPAQLRLALTGDEALREDLVALRASHERQAAWLGQLVGRVSA